MVGNNPYVPPLDDELEVSIFGPGYGECILLHVGENNWIIIDSCIDPISKEPSALKYLHRIGIGPTEAVKLVVATHWHDDHIRGLGDVFRKCDYAEFSCSTALTTQEFLALVGVFGTHPMIKSSGVQEFHTILQLIEDRKKSRGNISTFFKFATADRLLWRQPLSISGMNLLSEVYSLSPSDAAIFRAQKDIGALLPKEKKTKKRVISRRPNHVAVVLWIRIGNISVLLGSDLEETRDLGIGWSVILDSKTRPQEKASVFKIPHHGSENADHPRVWTDMLEPQPYSFLTPFIIAKTSLPTKADVKRICKNTENAFATAQIKKQRSKRRFTTVEKTIRETVRSIREVHASSGHIRLRCKIQSSMNWRIDLFDDAIPLKQMYVD